MILLIWRGWGLLALVALFPLFASCAGLTNTKPEWIFSVVMVLCLLVAGVVCVHCGTRWNRPVTRHTFFFVPLQAWGWVYLSLVTLVALFWVAAGLAYQTGLYRPPNPVDPNRVIAMAVVGGIALCAVVAVGLTRAPRADPMQ